MSSILFHNENLDYADTEEEEEEAESKVEVTRISPVQIIDIVPRRLRNLSPSSADPAKKLKLNGIELSTILRQADDDCPISILCVVSTLMGDSEKSTLFLGFLHRYLTAMEGPEGSPWNWMGWEESEKPIEYFWGDKSGIWAWPHLFKIRAANDNTPSQAILLLHATNKQLPDESCSSWDANKGSWSISTCLDFCLLISSCLVLHIPDGLTEDRLNLLKNSVKFSLLSSQDRQVIKPIDGIQQGTHYNKPFFQALHLLVDGYPNPHDDRVSYLKKFLSSSSPAKVGVSGGGKNKIQKNPTTPFSLLDGQNLVREHLRSCFDQEIQLTFLPPSSSPILNSKPPSLSTLPPKYATFLERAITTLMNPISSSCPVKMVYENKIEWREIFALFENYVKIFNRHKTTSPPLSELLETTKETHRKFIVHSSLSVHRRHMNGLLVGGGSRFFDPARLDAMIKECYEKSSSIFKNSHRTGSILDVEIDRGELSKMIREEMRQDQRMNGENRKRILQRAADYVDQMLGTAIEEQRGFRKPDDFLLPEPLKEWMNQLAGKLRQDFFDMIGQPVYTPTPVHAHATLDDCAVEQRCLAMPNTVQTVLEKFWEENEKLRQSSANILEAQVNRLLTSYQQSLRLKLENRYVDLETQLPAYHKAEGDRITTEFTHERSSLNLFPQYFSQMERHLISKFEGWKTLVAEQNEEKITKITSTLEKTKEDHLTQLYSMGMVTDKVKFWDDHNRLKIGAIATFKKVMMGVLNLFPGSESAGQKLATKYLVDLSTVLDETCSMVWESLLEQQELLRNIEKLAEQAFDKYGQELQSFLKNYFESATITKIQGEHEKRVKESKSFFENHARKLVTASTSKEAADSSSSTPPAAATASSSGVENSKTPLHPWQRSATPPLRRLRQRMLLQTSKKALATGVEHGEEDKNSGLSDEDRKIVECVQILEKKAADHFEAIVRRKDAHHLKKAEEDYGRAVMKGAETANDEITFNTFDNKAQAAARILLSKHRQPGTLPKEVNDKFELFMAASSIQSRNELKTHLRLKLVGMLEKFGLPKFINDHGFELSKRTLNQRKFASYLKVDETQMENLMNGSDRFHINQSIYYHVKALNDPWIFLDALQNSNNGHITTFISETLKQTPGFVQSAKNVLKSFIRGMRGGDNKGQQQPTEGEPTQPHQNSDQNQASGPTFDESSPDPSGKVDEEEKVENEQRDKMETEEEEEDDMVKEKQEEETYQGSLSEQFDHTNQIEDSSPGLVDYSEEETKDHERSPSGCGQEEKKVREKNGGKSGKGGKRRKRRIKK